MAVQYETKATNVGGRKGHVHTDDNAINVDVLPPQQADGNATNPEQLFAAGYAACFGNAVIHVTRSNKEYKIRDNDVEVLSTVGMVANGNGGFALTVHLDVTLSGISQADAEKIVEQTHQVCPYSNAIRGNIQVSTTVYTK